jgi:hypothetical protein
MRTSSRARKSRNASDEMRMIATIAVLDSAGGREVTGLAFV